MPPSPLCRIVARNCTPGTLKPFILALLACQKCGHQSRRSRSRTSSNKRRSTAIPSSLSNRGERVTERRTPGRGGLVLGVNSWTKRVRIGQVEGGPSYSYVNTLRTWLYGTKARERGLVLS